MNSSEFVEKLKNEKPEVSAPISNISTIVENELEKINATDKFKHRANSLWRETERKLTLAENERLVRKTDTVINAVVEGNITLDLIGLGSVADIVSKEYWNGKAGEFVNILSQIDGDPYAGLEVNSMEMTVYIPTTTNVMRGYEGDTSDKNAFRQIIKEHKTEESNKTIPFKIINFGLNRTEMHNVTGMVWWQPYKFPYESPLFHTDFNFTSRDKGIISKGDADFMAAHGNKIKPYNIDVFNGINQQLDNGLYASLDKTSSVTLPKSLAIAGQRAVDAGNTVLPNKATPTSMMLNVGGDLFSNMFDLYIAFNPGENDKSELDLPRHYDYNSIELNLLNGKVLAIRTAQINLPNISKAAGDTSFLMRTIPRKTSIVNQQLESSFVVDADENLYFLDYFQRYAGHANKLTADQLEKSNKSTLVSALSDHTELYNRDTMFPVNMLNLLSQSYLSETRGKLDLSKRRLCIIVKLLNLNPLIDTKYQNKSTDCPYFVFEDVKFLGTSNAIEFIRDNADTQQFTFGFIYRRCYPVLIYENKADVPVLGLRAAETLFPASNFKGEV